MMEILGAIFIIIFGCLGHFIFEWSGHKRIAGLFFAVNESTWEHIKLTIYPSFLWMIPELAVRGFTQTVLIAQFASMLTMMSLVPALFYGYTAFTKKNYLISDIAVFIVAVFSGEAIFSTIIESSVSGNFLTVISAIGIVLILRAYFKFSYNPPHNFLFKDPISGGFGPQGHKCESNFHTHNSHHHDS